MIPTIDEYKTRMWSRFRVWVKHEFNIVLPDKMDDLDKMTEDKLFTIDDLYASFGEGIQFCGLQTLQALKSEVGD